MAAEFRRKIEKYLKIRDKIEAAKTENFNRNLSVEDQLKFANDVHFNFLYVEEDIVKSYDKYREDKLKCEAAVYDYMNGQKTLMEIAYNYGLSYDTLNREIDLYKCLGVKYQYDRNVRLDKFSFTFQEEQLFLEFLKNFTVNKVPPLCSCKVCILERLSTLAYNYAKNSNKKYPIDWEQDKRVDISWLQEFELRYNIDITRFCIKSCIMLKEP